MLDAVTGPVASEPPVSCVIGAWLVKARYPVRVVTAELLAMAGHGLLTVEAGAEGYTLRVVAKAGTLSRDRQAIIEGLLLGEPEGLLTRPPRDKAEAGTAARSGRLTTDRLRTAIVRNPAGDPGPVPPAWHFPWAMVLLPDPLMDWWIQRNVRATPPWWTSAHGTAAAFLSYDGANGFFAAVRYSMIVD